MANAILNFHFDFPHPSLKNNVRVSEGQLVDGSFDVKSNSRNERDLDLTVRVQREEEEGV